MKSEVIEAIRMLAKEKEIPEETLFKTIEEALKAAYKKNLPKSETAPNNLDVTVNRQNGSISVYARKLILEDEYGFMVGYRNREIVKVPLEDVAGKLKMLDPDAAIIKEAKMLGISFGD